MNTFKKFHNILNIPIFAASFRKRTKQRIDKFGYPNFGSWDLNETQMRNSLKNSELNKGFKNHMNERKTPEHGIIFLTTN